MHTGKLKPVLRWAGSKQRKLPELLQRVPTKFGRYIEPFAGSAALFFALNPRVASLSDVNPSLINFYSNFKKTPAELYQVVSELDVNPREYSRIRDEFNLTSDSFLRACYFYYLNRACFNGLYRTNRLGKFNVPIGKKLPALPSEEHFMRCASVLRKAKIMTSDYEGVIDTAERGDFLYVDPPYERASLRDRGEYGAGAMQDADMPRLIDSLQRASRRGARVMISYNSCLKKALPDWARENIGGRYLISANPNNRPVIQEFTIRNY